MSKKVDELERLKVENQKLKKELKSKEIKNSFGVDNLDIMTKDDTERPETKDRSVAKMKRKYKSSKHMIIDASARKVFTNEPNSATVRLGDHDTL